MDPNAALRRLRDAIDAQDWTDAVGALNDYYQWRLKGGFHGLSIDRLEETGDQCADRLANELQDRLP